MSLTNIQVDKAKSGAKDRKLFDENGRYLLVKSTGYKWWRLKYRFGARADGKPGKAEKVLALGVYPEVSLKRAREKRDEARQLLADGIDPSAERKAAEAAQRIAHLGTFEAVAHEWLKRLCVSQREKRIAADEREYAERVAAPARVRQGDDDGAWIPIARQLPAKRTAVEQGCDRAAVGPWGAG